MYTMSLFSANTFTDWFGQLWYANGGDFRLMIVVVILFIPITLFGIIASVAVDGTFRRYQHVASSCGMTAAQVAKQMLEDSGIYGVNIQQINGHLTDHFDPRNNTISLSNSVYGSNSIAAIAVACHEVGHAIQHEQGYLFSALRLRMVPILNFANRTYIYVMIAGIVFTVLAFVPYVGPVLIVLGILMFSLSAIFSLITLPTEFNASSRAKAYLANGVLEQKEVKKAGSVLTAAAMTYVAGFLSSLLQVLKLLAILLMILGKGKKK